MQAFRMHEFVYVGDPDGAIAHRDRWLERGTELLRSLGLDVEVVVANDPFFGRVGKVLAANQIDEALKLEFVTPITSTEAPDRHHVGELPSGPLRPHLRNRNRPTARWPTPRALPIGVDRTTLALLATHGLDPERWPDGGEEPALAVTLQLFALDATKYVPHSLHGGDRTWTETNCWLDMMIEVLHIVEAGPGGSGGLHAQHRLRRRTVDPVQVSRPRTFAPSTGWRWPRCTCGAPPSTTSKSNWPWAASAVWRSTPGSCPTPQASPTKRRTPRPAIVPQMLDRTGRKMGYFHNAGYFEVSGDDFDGLFYLAGLTDAYVLPPYMETIRLDRIRHISDDDLTAAALALTREHLARRAVTNPLIGFRERLMADLPWLVAGGDEAFHPYAFATCRQCGATAELAASFVDWLGTHASVDLGDAAANLRVVAECAKSLQFILARLAHGRSVDPTGPLEEMERAWGAAIDALVAHYGE